VKNIEIKASRFNLENFQNNIFTKPFPNILFIQQLIKIIFFLLNYPYFRSKFLKMLSQTSIFTYAVSSEYLLLVKIPLVQG